jgi:hypothetical protein
MITITLLAKIYSSHQLKQLDKIFAELIGDLSVETTVKGTTDCDWVQINLSGEDETVATNLLKREIGFCPISIVKIEKFDVLKGYVTNFGKNKEELDVDIGIFQPRPVNAVLSLNHLQEKLVSVKDWSVKRICEMWGINENLPLTVRLLEVEAEKSQIEAEVETSQTEKLFRWRDSLLERLIVIGASQLELKHVVESEGLTRDVIDIEPLGLFEHTLVCKLGTNAAGLIGRIGRRLRKAKFTVFDPKKIEFANTRVKT